MRILIRFLLLAAAPVMVHAYEFGPDPGYTNAPGDNKTSCISSGCHSGTVNSGPGKVQVLLPSGNSGTYTPGQSMQLLVQITDATKAAYGFELTARMGSGNTTQAGDFTTADANTQVICADGSPKKGTSCAAPFNVEYIEHSLAGFNASVKQTPSFTYTMSWTPPATASGPITFFVAGNAGVGLPAVAAPSDVYTSTLTLNPASSAPTGPPTIDPGGVVPVDSSVNTIQPGSWASIYSTQGQNLASGTAVWNGDFPQKLGGVTVTVNGKNAALWFVSPSQINFQAPDDTATGSVPVVVTNANGSATTSVTLAPQGPAFLLLGDGKHAIGQIFPAQGAVTLLGPTSAGAGFRAVKAGETLVLYGIGFGPTNPFVPAGQAFSGSAPLTTAPQISLGNVPLQLSFAGLISAGLYQFNTTVPANTGSGDVQLTATVNGVSTPVALVPVQ